MGLHSDGVGGFEEGCHLDDIRHEALHLGAGGPAEVVGSVPDLDGHAVVVEGQQPLEVQLDDDLRRRACNVKDFLPCTTAPKLEADDVIRSSETHCMLSCDY